MINFSKEELLKIAKLSSLKLNENEAEVLVDQIKLILNYTEELDQAKVEVETSPIKNVNIFRKDEIKKFDSSQILEQAPETKEQYFIVPKMLK